MPFNGSGSFSLSSNLTANTRATAASVNSILTDIATGLSNAVAKDGQSTLTGPIKFAAGTVAAPGQTWASETGTGFYRYGAGDIRYSVSGSDVFKITSSGLTMLSGSFSGTLANNTVSTAMVVANAVTNAKLAQMAAGTVKANVTGSTADPSDVTLAALLTALGITSIPTGMISMFPLNTAPTGWLELDGSTKSRATYPSLWTFANASANIVSDASWSASSGGFSLGDGSTTFRLPDYRGMFPRGWDHARGVDSGRIIGSYQADAFQSWTAVINSRAVGVTSGAVSSGASVAVPPGTGGTADPIVDITINPSLTARTASETRPVNVPVMYCIKT